MKRFGKVLAAAALASVLFATSVSAEALRIASAAFTEIKVVIDGTEVYLNKPIAAITNNAEGELYARTYMPLRGVMESLGYTVVWDGDADEVKLIPPVLEIDGKIAEQRFFDVGSARYVVALLEDADAGLWWDCVFTETQGFVLAGEEWFDTQGKTMHRFIFEADRTFAGAEENKPLVTFEKKLGDEEVGHSIAYSWKFEAADFMPALPDGAEIVETAYRNTALTQYNKKVDAGLPLISIQNQYTENADIYMPLRGALEALGHEVIWDGDSNSVILNRGIVSLYGETVRRAVVGAWAGEYTFVLPEAPEDCFIWVCETNETAGFTVTGNETAEGDSDGNLLRVFTIAHDASVAIDLPQEGVVAAVFEKQIDGVNVGQRVVLAVSAEVMAAK